MTARTAGAESPLGAADHDAEPAVDPQALQKAIDLACAHVNRRVTTVLAWGCAILITGLNMFLLYQQLFMG